jgi:hypothetical protein
LAQLTNDDFTEYYNSAIIASALKNELETYPIEMVAVQDNRESNILDWMEKGNKK